MRDICRDCYLKEEEAFEIVYKFLRKRTNREATLKEIVEATGVEEELIIKFIKEKRLRTSDFPKLAYPCERCGIDIVSGRMCQSCSDSLLKGFTQQEKVEKINREREKESVNVYYTFKHQK